MYFLKSSLLYSQGAILTIVKKTKYTKFAGKNCAIFTITICCLLCGEEPQYVVIYKKIHGKDICKYAGNR
jgi:hypothetical protein